MADSRDPHPDLEALFESAPLVMILLDRDLLVVRANRAADLFACRNIHEVIGRPIGEAILCANSLEDPRGCGFGPACETCPVRRTVVSTFADGVDRHRTPVELPFIRGGDMEVRNLLVSTIQLETAGRAYVLLCVEDVTELHDLLAQARRDTQIKQNLLRELNHRVKNNLITVASFLQLERQQPSGGKAEFITNCLRRVRSLGELHEILCEDAGGSVDAASLVRRIAETLVFAGSAPEPQLELETETGGLRLSSDRAGAIAMLVSELITNALRHGLADTQPPKLRIAFTHDAQNGQLTVADNGGRLTAGFDPSKDEGTGLKIIHFIVEKQLHGQFEITAADGWTTARVRFPSLTPAE